MYACACMYVFVCSHTWVCIINMIIDRYTKTRSGILAGGQAYMYMTDSRQAAKYRPINIREQNIPAPSSFATKNMPTVSIDVFWLQWLLSFVPLLGIRSIRLRIRLFGKT